MTARCRCVIILSMENQVDCLEPVQKLLIQMGTVLITTLLAIDPLFRSYSLGFIFMDSESPSTLLTISYGNTSSISLKVGGRRTQGPFSRDHGKTCSISQKTRSKRTRGPYKGSRLRDGKWVSEIRIPKTTTRIWLGSHNSPENAALAYDYAIYCIHGPEGKFNFPDSSPQLFSQPIGNKSTDEIVRMVKGFISAAGMKVPTARHSSKSVAPRLSLDKPVVPGSLDLTTDEVDLTADKVNLTEMAACKVNLTEIAAYKVNLTEIAAHKVNLEPVTTTNVSEVEPHLPEPVNVLKMEPYIPEFMPEEEIPFPYGSLAFDEAFIKGSDEWILDFMVERP